MSSERHLLGLGGGAGGFSQAGGLRQSEQLLDAGVVWLQGFARSRGPHGPTPLGPAEEREKVSTSDHHMTE